MPTISPDFLGSVRGFPPCASGIGRKQYFDPLVHQLGKTDKKPNFHHPWDLMSKIRKQKPWCSSSWAIATVSCLGDIYGLADGKNPELDCSFLVSCYSPRKFSKYYRNWGCGGDSVYNAVFFLFTNGTISDTCWEQRENDTTQDIYTIGESDISEHLEPSTCSKKSIKCANPILYRIGELKIPGTPNALNISPILTSDGKLVTGKGDQDTWENFLGHLKYKISQAPAITTFIVLDTFVTNFQNMSQEMKEDWGPNDIYHPKEYRDVVGFHSAVIVGWGPTPEEKKKNPLVVPYWILRNSWGQGWGPRYLDIPNGYWKHAMYPNCVLGAVDISLDPQHPLVRKIPPKYRRGPLGGIVAIGMGNEGTPRKLDVSSLKYAPYIRDFGEEYPTYVWVIFLVCLVVIFLKAFWT